MRRLEGRIALVTGAASGIGRAIALRLSAERMQVLLVDRDAAKLAEVERELTAAGAWAHTLDVTDASAWAVLAATLEAQGRSPALLVHAAGLTVHGPFLRNEVADIDRVVSVDLLGPMYGCRALLPAMQAQGDAHVVLVSSMAAMVGVPLQATYSAAKAGLRAFGETLRTELAPLGIGVTTVMPGTIATPFLHHATSRHTTTSTWMAEAMVRHGRSPDAVARAVVKAIRRDRAELVVGWDAHATRVVQRLLPGLLPLLLRLAWRRLRPDRPELP